jgi:1-acyl-sn-glycerol-3-phosphate acyltransferase
MTTGPGTGGEEGRQSPWQYNPADDLDRPLIERLRHFPRRPDMLVYGSRTLVALALRAWLLVYHRYTVAGRGNLPASGSFVVVANHASHLDALCLQCALPMRRLHRTFSAAASDYFFDSVPLTWAATVVANALPFSREVKIRQSLSLCAQLLENPGNVLILFPEGTRTKTGELGRFKPGIGALVAGRDIPVVPCFLDGAFRALRKGVWFPRPARLTLRIGPPLRFADAAPGREGAHAIATVLEKAVAALKP